MKGHGVTKENNRIRFAAVTIERRRPIGIQGRAARGSMSHRFLAEFNRQFLVRTQAGGVFRWKVIGNGIRHRSGGGPLNGADERRLESDAPIRLGVGLVMPEMAEARVVDPTVTVRDNPFGGP